MPRTEAAVTQTGADSLLEDVADSITVRLPGGQAVSVKPAAVPIPPTSILSPVPSSTGVAPPYSPVHSISTTIESVPVSARPNPSIAPAVSTRHRPSSSQQSLPANAPIFTPSTNSGPSLPSAPSSAVPPASAVIPSALINGHTGQSVPSPHPLGSETGSMSSVGPIPLPAPPPGIGLTPNGEYYDLATGAPVALIPNDPVTGRPMFPPLQRRFASSQLYNQSYSPDHLAQQTATYPFPQQQLQQHDSFDGRSSPFGFPAQSPGIPVQLAGMPGYFMPAKTSKISIRSPTGTDQIQKDGRSSNGPSRSRLANGSGQSQMAQMSQAYYAQTYNPYTGQIVYDNGAPTSSEAMMNGTEYYAQQPQQPQQQPPTSAGAQQYWPQQNYPNGYFQGGSYTGY